MKFIHANFPPPETAFVSRLLDLAINSDKMNSRLLGAIVSEIDALSLAHGAFATLMSRPAPIPPCSQSSTQNER
jgi:hypothetical protein